MPSETTSIKPTAIVRQPSEPPGFDGQLWINPAGGASGNNTERYIYRSDTNVWELDTSVGPDTPLREVDGSFWQDTSVNPPETKVFDGSGASWSSIGKDNAPDWVIDPNSPYTVNDTDSPNYTLSSSYDTIMLMATVSDAGGSGTMTIRLNSNASFNYNYIDDGGAETTGDSRIDNVAQFTSSGTHLIRMGFTDEGNGTVSFYNESFSESLGTRCNRGYLTNTNGISEINFRPNGLQTIDYKIVVYGLTL